MRTALLLLGALAAAPVAEDPAPAKPPAPTALVETLRGMRVDLLVPGAKPEEGYSLLVYFHDRSGNGKQAAALLAPFAERGFVVAAPWSKQGDWTMPEIETVKGIASDLVAKYGPARERRHVAGHWTGADGVPTLAFDEALGFRTATWIDSYWGGGSVPKWAKDELNGLFLWGPREGASRADRCRKSASLLSEKARLACARGAPQDPGQPRGGREEPAFPTAEIPFWGYFLECMEGRFEPGRDLSYPWEGDLEAAKTAMAERKTGGFAVIYAAKPEGPEADRARALQVDVLFDRTVRHFADQLVPVRLEKAAAKELMEAAKVTATPAVVVFKRGGKEILKSVAGEVTTKALVPLLRAAAPDPEMPK